MNKHNNTIANHYDIISNSFDNSRVRIWNNVKLFLNNYNSINNNLLDVGCGNGKNMIYAETLGYKCTGYDISTNLLNVCRNKNLNVYYYDVLNNKSITKYDKIICIAVLHHLDTCESQIIAINNMLSQLNSNGELLISFWSKEKYFNIDENMKNKNDYRNFEVGPNYVDWKLSKDNIIKRFYYIHDHNSIIKLADSINCNYKLSWELQNWFILFKK
tara:strand:- start:11644 stop:12291 length:648 start_codon:yes stop_codon:yes gene_type:complete